MPTPDSSPKTVINIEAEEAMVWVSNNSQDDISEKNAPPECSPEKLVLDWI